MFCDHWDPPGSKNRKNSFCGILAIVKIADENESIQIGIVLQKIKYQTVIMGEEA